MKIHKTILFFLLLPLFSEAYAHCPSSYKKEKVCFMLENNTVYIYDHKLEHNGPYKDFEKAELKAIKASTGEVLAFKKLARGIYKIEGAAKQKSLDLEVSLDKKKDVIKLSHE